MKYIFLKASVILLLVVFFAKGVGENLEKSNIFTASYAESFVNTETNLVVFGPPYGTKQLVNINDMLATNGLVCWLDVPGSIPVYGSKPDLGVYIYNHATNDVACLRMPATNLCRIALLDKQGHQVERTSLGMMYGLPLSQEQIDWWRHHWHKSNQSIFLRLFPNGLSQYVDTPTEIVDFNAIEAFKIKEPGEYELHLQLRFVQIGKDNLGNFHYPITWLPEVTTKIKVQAKDILPMGVSLGGQVQSERTNLTTNQETVCIDRLAAIQIAKYQWGFFNSKRPDAVPTWDDIRPFFPRSFPKTSWTNGILVCPDGGTYTLGRLGVPPTCSIGGPGHSLPQ
jgi:hypothetical protein